MNVEMKLPAHTRTLTHMQNALTLPTLYLYGRNPFMLSCIQILYSVSVLTCFTLAQCFPHFHSVSVGQIVAAVKTISIEGFLMDQWGIYCGDLLPDNRRNQIFSELPCPIAARCRPD